MATKTSTSDQEYSSVDYSNSVGAGNVNNDRNYSTTTTTTTYHPGILEDAVQAVQASQQQSPPGGAKYQSVEVSVAGSDAPMFPADNSFADGGHNSHHQQQQQQQQQADLQVAEDLRKLRSSCYRLCLLEGVLSVALLLTFWAAFVVPFIVGVIGLVTAILGATHFSSQRDLHFNNCCCAPVPARGHIVNLHLALTIADMFGIMCSVAGFCNAFRQTGDERTYRMIGSILCLITSLVLVMAAGKNLSLCKKLRHLVPTPQIAAIPMAQYQMYSPMADHQYHHQQGMIITRQQPPVETQYYYATAVPQRQQQQPVVVGTIVA